jgi:hypothetical protein
LTLERQELVMLLQASIEIANAERWALEIGEPAPPASLQQSLRRTAYEVTVVDNLHRIARRYFAQRGALGVWERPFPTGLRGRPETVDVALFNDVASTETRIELGLYTNSKLRTEASKLARLATDALPDYPTIENLILLWLVDEETLTKQTPGEAVRRFRDASTTINASHPDFRVLPLLASSVDLFTARPGGSRRATAGLFQVEIVGAAPADN